MAAVLPCEMVAPQAGHYGADCTYGFQMALGTLVKGLIAVNALSLAFIPRLSSLILLCRIGYMPASEAETQRFREPCQRPHQPYYSVWIHFL
jgi:hypothetical protein